MDPFCHYHRYGYIKIRFSPFLPFFPASFAARINRRYNVFEYIKRKSAARALFVVSPSISRLCCGFLLFSQSSFPKTDNYTANFVRTFCNSYFPFKASFQNVLFAFFFKVRKIIDFLFFRKRFRFLSYRLKDFFLNLSEIKPSTY